MGAAIRACPYRRVEMEKTGSRVAMGLLCGLAICCAVMYITADGADVQETILAPAKSVYGIGGPTSVDSEDVEKVGTVFTNTPDGRMRLTDYLTNVEKEIAAEEAARKRDVAAVPRRWPATSLSTRLLLLMVNSPSHKIFSLFPM